VSHFLITMLNAIMLCVVMLRVIMLSVVMLIVIKQNVVMLSVVAPNSLEWLSIWFNLNLMKHFCLRHKKLGCLF